jgi:nucleoside-diphosphate-sugar epimerase
MRIFVAGATGAIGRRLVPLLLARGHRVTAMTRRAGAAAALGADEVVCDAFDRPGIHRAIAAARPDVVVHQLTDLAAADTAANARMRIEGTRNLVDAARANGVRRMVAQSIAWAYAAGEAPATEDEPLDLEAPEPRLATVRGVAALEDAVRELPEWTILRYGMLYGPGTWYAGDGLRAEQARAGELAADADVASFVHVGDAASACVAALGWPTGAVNVCDEDPAPGREWLPVFCEAVGAPAPPVSDRPRAGWARGAANARARELGWVPRHPSWRESRFAIAA